ncbi:MAG: hypothetical protein JO340_01360 [Acidobacteriaceae bacterium]|nr:hypothetical protein [Acidobacteriaceae bacterium]
MRALLFACSIGLAVVASAPAGNVNVADFPLRVHLFQVSQHSHYYRGQMDFVDGEGRANLYENSEARGFDYSFRCGERLMTSSGFETYLARWKKPGRELELVLPVMGNPNAAKSCSLKVELKNSVYLRHNGSLEQEPVAAYKAWMEKHQYDPEHGRNEPVNLTPATANGATSPP